MVDRQTAFIGEDHRKQLGEWSRRRLKSVAAKEEDARKRLVDCGIPVDELRIHWKEQREAQLSVRARTFSLSLPPFSTKMDTRCACTAKEGT